MQNSGEKNDPLTRGEFLDFSGLVIGSIAAGGFLGSQEEYIPKSGFVSEYEEEPLDPYSLSLVERMSPLPRPDFVTIENGHKYSLRYVVLNSPIIQENIARGYNNLFRMETPPTMKDMFIEQINYARESLQKEFDLDSVPPYWQMYQCLSFATYALTGTLGAWISMGELRNMGVNFPRDYMDPDAYGTAPVYRLWWLFPSLFSLKRDDSVDYGSSAHLFLASGKDRSVHFMHHFLLAFRYIALYLSKSSDSMKIPRFIDTGLDLVKGISDVYGRALLLSDLAGFAWEVKETIGDEGTVANFIDQPGLRDPVVFFDFKANSLGSRSAVKVFSYLTNNTDKSFEELMEGLSKIFSELEKFKDTGMTLCKNRRGTYYIRPNILGPK